MTKEIAKTPEQSLLFDADKFEHAQRVGKMLSSSTMVPQHFRDNIGNCVIALNYAHRAGIDPFMAMQKMYIIHGKPAIETQLQVALFNKSGRFGTLKFKMNGQDGAKAACIAYAYEKETKERIEGPVVSIQMAKDEGWYNKNSSKWKTLPELMLRYRAASFFIRLYAPETTMGLSTTEELNDIDAIDVTPDPQEEMNQNANTEVIDVEPEKAIVEKKPVENSVISEEEKAEILAEEKRIAMEEQQQKNIVPGF